MKVKLIENHDGEGLFPLFKKGTAVNIIEDCKFYLNWQKCSIKNIETYIPKSFVENGVLVVDYNPTELIANKDDIVEVLDIVFGWIYGIKNGSYGWIPCYKCTSLFQ